MDYSSKHKNIKIINQENKGVIEARINGYKNSTGEYIGWVDADDFIKPNMFEKLYSLIMENGADVSICNYEFYPNKVVNKNKWYNPYKGELDWKFLSKSTVQWNKLIKKSLLEQMNFEYLLREFGEGCYSLILINANKIITTDDELYSYRVGQTSLSSNFKNIEWYKKTINRSQKKLNFVIKEKYDEKWIEFVKYGYLYYNLILMIVASYNNDKITYNDSKKIIVEEKFFSNKYKKYLKNSFGNIKYLFFKYVAVKSFYMLKIISKLVLR